MGWIVNTQDPRVTQLWPGVGDGLGADDLLFFVFKVARIQCERFAPALPEGAAVPENYVAAQVMQARALVRAGITGSGDQSGGYGETVAVFPMDWTVKNLLRPRRGRPYFGGVRP